MQIVTSICRRGRTGELYSVATTNAPQKSDISQMKVEREERAKRIEAHAQRIRAALSI